MPVVEFSVQSLAILVAGIEAELEPHGQTSQQQSYGIVFVTLVRTAVGTAIAAQWRSGHYLNIFVVLAAVQCILGLPGWRLLLSLHFAFFPFPLCPRP